MSQLGLFSPPSVGSEPTGWWADAGRWMVGEGEYPAVAAPVRRERPAARGKATPEADAAPLPDQGRPWVDRTLECGCVRRERESYIRGWREGYTRRRCEVHAGGKGKR